MTLIQPLLILFFVGALLLYRRKFKSRLVDRIIVFGIATAAVTLIVFPDFSTTVAHLVGVGRGADLVTYLSLVGIAFCGLLVFSRIRSLESRLTELVRELALLEADGNLKREPSRDEHAGSTAFQSEGASFGSGNV